MSDDVTEVLKDAESRMKSAVHALEENLKTIRTGRANPALVEKLMVEYYGTPTPLYQMATIGVPEPMLITIKPFDKTSLHPIEKAIQASDLGLNPNNDGTLIRLALPPLTSSLRRSCVKGGSARRISVPSLFGFKPRSDAWIAFSMGCSDVLSNGLMVMSIGSGTPIVAIW